MCGYFDGLRSTLTLHKNYTSVCLILLRTIQHRCRVSETLILTCRMKVKLNECVSDRVIGSNTSLGEMKQKVASFQSIPENHYRKKPNLDRLHCVVSRAQLTLVPMVHRLEHSLCLCGYFDGLRSTLSFQKKTFLCLLLLNEQ